MTNEAAERLEPGDMYCDTHARCEGRDPFRHPGQFIWSLEDDRAAERRATVERIGPVLDAIWDEAAEANEALVSVDLGHGEVQLRPHPKLAERVAHAILDEEAAR